ncbi:hypothetical protein GCM10009117_23830 [Gangjinia marincola]|uniref:HYR domain-containing protein n=1 Tax=Gangjinia marincola TaxID=578463 RepID=A0ABN1MJT4_9FLAO
MKKNLLTIQIGLFLLVTSFMYAQVDTEAPILNCPGDLVETADPGSCSATVNFTISATDNCSAFLGDISGFTSLGSFGGKTYYISDSTFLGPEVYDEVAVSGYRLVSIDSQAENDFIRNQANAAGFTGVLWIGLNDRDIEGTFVWQNETDVVYTNWDAGEPNNSGNEDEVEMLANGRWNDENFGNHPYVIEFSGTLVQTAGIASGGVYPIGTTTNTFVATDFSGNTSTCSFDVTVTENEDPNAAAQNVTIVLDDSGNASTTAADVDNGSSDNCGIADISLNQTDFDCNDLGANSVTLTVIDTSGNTASTTATVTVVDTTAPNVVTEDITVSLGSNGTASIGASAINDGSSDNCGITSISLSQNTFDCDDLGANTVTLTIGDASGNSASATAIVTVVDDSDPVAITQNITVSLDDDGIANINPGQVNNGSNDNCGINGINVSQIEFDCDDLGDNTVTLTVTDTSGNTASQTAVVTVVDDTAPTVITQDLTVSLDANGSASITGSQVDNGSNDNCGSIFRNLDQNSFDCEDIGQNTVTLTVQDGNGNSATGTAIITVVDDLAPEFDNAGLPLDQTVSYTTDTGYEVEDFTLGVTANDNCDATVTQSIAQGTELTMGVYTVTLTATDASGNETTYSFELTVEENLSTIDVDLANVSIFPNPAKDQILIDGVNVPFTATVFDISGKLILTTSSNAINTSLWQSGVYLVKINSSTGSVLKRLIKE